ncbi:MAG TPA: glutaredoxin family protein [Myxococcota bacterium]|nr:glutaredoxin family protein [Myxococcota bacterium]
MTRRSLALLALLAPLWACSPPSQDGAVVPVGSPEDGAPVTPKPARERAPATPARRSGTLKADGGYYQYVDESGRVRFATSLDQVPERQRSTAGHITVEASASRAVRRASVAPDDGPRGKTTHAPVVMYSTQSCGYCRRARAYFDQIGQEYVDKDVENDDDAREEFLGLTHGNTGVPVIVIGGKMIQGWSQPRVEQMLAASR